jgi:class 3 adenylate cyclase
MVQEQPSRVGRRLSAIVAADVAGYSRLMGLDETGTARILREHRAVSDALVAKHGGRIVKTTGDGVLLEFASVVQGTSKMLRGIGAIFQIAQDRAVKAGSCFHGRSRHHQPVLVSKH